MEEEELLSSSEQQKLAETLADALAKSEKQFADTLVQENMNYGGQFGYTEEEVKFIEQEAAKAKDDTERAKLIAEAIKKLYEGKKLSKPAVEDLYEMTDHTEVTKDGTYTTGASVSEDFEITRFKK